MFAELLTMLMLATPPASQPQGICGTEIRTGEVCCLMKLDAEMAMWFCDKTPGAIVIGKLFYRGTMKKQPKKKKKPFKPFKWRPPRFAR